MAATSPTASAYSIRWCLRWSRYRGADHVGVRLSPNGDSQGVDDSNPEPLFTAAAAALDARGIAFLELREPDENGTFGSTTVPRLSPAIRKVFKGPLILNSDYTLEIGTGRDRQRRGRCNQFWPTVHFEPRSGRTGLQWAAPLAPDTMAAMVFAGARRLYRLSNGGLTPPRVRRAHGRSGTRANPL